MLDQIPVIDGAQSEILEGFRALQIDRVVELPAVRLDEPCGLVADDPDLLAGRDRLGERVYVLIPDFLMDVGVEQPRRQA